MLSATIEEAQSRLAHWIDQASPGEDVLTMQNDEPVARTIAIKGRTPKRKAGSADLWFAFDDPKLSQTAKALIELEETVLLSVAGVWEMAIKYGGGGLKLPLPVADFVARPLAQNGITLLPIELPHLARVSALPYHHRDPFDRMLIAQSLVLDTPIVSVDKAFDAYGVPHPW